MARSGVRPLGERGGKPKEAARRPQTAPATPSVAPSARAPSVSPSVAPPGNAPTQPRSPPAAPLSAPKGAAEGRAELWAELERLRAESELRGRELRELRAGLEAERQARAGLEVERQTLQGSLAGAAHQIRAQEERLVSLEAERDAAEHHRRTLQRALEEARGAIPAPPASARAIFEARGLLGDSEIDVVVRGLGEQREGGGLLALLEVADPSALESFLEDRVSLLCGEPACAAPPGRAILKVPPPRCDVCGGSDIRRATRRFQEAALLNGLSRVVIVGGSPQYHRQLKALLTEPRLRLTLVPGDRRRNLRQAQADEAGADLVVLWGATLLDHSTSELYGRGSGRVLRVPHRGIARMLLQVADALA